MPKSVTIAALLRLLAILIALPMACLAATVPASASDRLRWPSDTYLAPPKPDWVGGPRWVDKTVATPRAVAAPQTSSRSLPATSDACAPGEMCVKCVANCNDRAPATVQRLDPGQVAAAKPASGPPDYPIGHGRWNAIRCYAGGGCTASGVSAPRRIERSSDGYVSYWRFW